jgi:hypothetical protein
MVAVSGGFGGVGGEGGFHGLVLGFEVGAGLWLAGRPGWWSSSMVVSGRQVAYHRTYLFYAQAREGIPIQKICPLIM